MTTVPVRHAAVGVVPARPGASPLGRLIAFEARAEAGLKVFLQRWSIPALRVALGGVFLVFGALKFVPGMSRSRRSSRPRGTASRSASCGQGAHRHRAIEVLAGALLIAGERSRASGSSCWLSPSSGSSRHRAAARRGVQCHRTQH